MTKPISTSSTTPTEHPLTVRLRRVFPNASALPVAPASLNILLRDTIVSVEFRQLLPQYAEWNTDARLVVTSIYRRLSATERFRLHSSLVSILGYVPTWIQEITS